MSEKGHRGSFVGFTYNNIHSSTLGITRVSSSSRYTDALIPTLKDVTTDIVGTSGVVYFGTTYVKRQFSVSFAFDGLTEAQIRNIQTNWHDKQIHDLIFDEWPYKVYSAKVTGLTSLKYLQFTDKDGDHFRGEGSIQFTCYFPFARSRYPWREDYNLENIPEWRNDAEFDGIVTLSEGGNIYYDLNTAPDVSSEVVGNDFAWVEPQSLLHTRVVDTDDVTTNSELILYHYSDSPYINYNDWIVSSGIPSRENYGIYDDGAHSINLYNAGDVTMPSQWYYKVDDTPMTIAFICDGSTKLTLTNLQQSHAPSPTGAGADYYIIIDMPRAVIQGYDRYNRPTGRLYNQYITQGDFFGIPVGAHTIQVAKPMDIKFNYLYL